MPLVIKNKLCILIFTFVSHPIMLQDVIILILPKRKLRFKVPQHTIFHSQLYSQDLNANLLSTSGYMDKTLICFLLFCGLIVKWANVNKDTHILCQHAISKLKRELRFLRMSIYHQNALYFDSCLHSSVGNIRKIPYWGQ